MRKGTSPGPPHHLAEMAVILLMTRYHGLHRIVQAHADPDQQVSPSGTLCP